MNAHLQRIALRKPQILGPAGLHDAYIEAVNAALAAGRDEVAAELAATYADEDASITQARPRSATHRPRSSGPRRYFGPRRSFGHHRSPR